MIYQRRGMRRRRYELLQVPGVTGCMAMAHGKVNPKDTRLEHGVDGQVAYVGGCPFLQEVETLPAVFQPDISSL